MDSSVNPPGLEAFADVRRAIIVAAHADDMETLMGGTMIKLRELGVVFHELICTAGDIGSNEPGWSRDTLGAARVGEARDGAARLGVESIEFLGNPDGELEANLQLRAEIALSYRRFMPDTLFTFDPTGFLLNHPDHGAVGRTALDAIIPSRMRLYHPEHVIAGAEPPHIRRVFLWTPAQIDVVVDVSDVYEQKLAICHAHKSQFPEPSSLDWMRNMNRASGERIGVEYAEVFRKLDS